jgi:hypothetical protein
MSFAHNDRSQAQNALSRMELMTGSSLEFVALPRHDRATVPAGGSNVGTVAGSDCCRRGGRCGRTLRRVAGDGMMMAAAEFNAAPRYRSLQAAMKRAGRVIRRLAEAA